MSYNPIARLDRISQGKCGSCSGKPLATPSMCARCRELVKKNAKKQRERRKLARVCITCATPLAPDRKAMRCRSCTEKVRDKYRASMQLNG